MSWWTDNREKLLGGLGLLGMAATGVGIPAALKMAPEAIGAGLSGASLGDGLLGPTTAGAKGFMGLGATLGGANSPNMGTALMGLNMLGNKQQQTPMPMAPPPRPSPMMQTPSPSIYGGDKLSALLADPNLPPEIRQKLMAMQGGIYG